MYNRRLNRLTASAPQGWRAFSLIEVLIVAAILSILASIAVINVQHMMEDARRKAAMAEARSIATALTFARQETGFFPKLNYLIEQLMPNSPHEEDGVVDPNTNKVRVDFEYMSRPLTDPNDLRIQGTWTGPYFSLSQTAKSSAEGTQGYSEIELPDREHADGTKVYRRWPKDHWKRPYVVYLLGVEPRLPSDQKLGNVTFLHTPTKAPNFAAAVVSYGPDGYPGALRYKDGTERARKSTQRLYEDLNNEDYRMLIESQYDVSLPAGRMRLEGYAEQRFKDVTGYTATRDGYVGVTDIVGVVDPNGGTRRLPSDDVIIEF